MSTTTNLSSLVINYLTQAQYDAAAQAGTLNENQIYLTPAVEFTETDPTVPSWAKQTNKPSYNFSEIGSTPTTLSGYGITNAYTKTEVDGLVSGVLHYKGTKTSSSALPSSGNTTGDVWHVTDTGAEYAWDGSTWQELGTAIDLSGYLPITGGTVTGQTYFEDSVELDYFNAIHESGSGYYIISQGWNDETGINIGYYNGYSGGLYGLEVLKSSDSTEAYVHLRGLETPLTDYEAANKKYVDDSISAISIPTKTSDLTNDSGFLTSYTETDPTVPSWAKQSSKPTYTASEVGAMSTSHAANGITAAKINAWDAKSDFSGSYNDLTDKPTIPTVPTNISAFTNDSGYLTSYTETDPTVPSWAKASSKPSYALTEISGTDDLRAIEALTGTTGLLKKTATNTWTLDTNTYLTSYTETDPVFSASAAAGITSTDISNWNGKTSNIGTITSVKTTAGAHTVIDVTSGAASFNVPTKTSHLTNDSGFITTDTNTTYTLSNALSSHKFTWTFTAGGSGSGSTTTTAELVAGTGITLTDDTTNKKITIASSLTTFQSTTATLTTAGWSSKTQTVNVTGVTASNTVVVSPAPTSHVAYCDAGIYCSAQGAGTLTFTCDEVPESALTVNILYK